MIPILYRSDELTFTSNGLGRLTECVSCIVTEERNGIFECEFVYPVTGRYYKEMVDNGGIIGVIHDDHHDIQRFDIYSYSAPIDGMVTFNAHHVSYRLNQIILEPFDASSIGDAFTKIPLKAMTTCDFSFHTDKSSVSLFELTHPANIRSILSGTEGSILDVYGGGDYKWDNMTVWLYNNRGTDTGVTVRYGKNMADIRNEVDESASYSAIVPYWVGGEDDVVYGSMVISSQLRGKDFPWTEENLFEMEDGNGNIIQFRTPIITPKEVDFTQDFETKPTPQQLRTRAQQYMQNNETWKLRQNIKVNFVQLWQTPEYENVSALQRVSLCDYVSVYFPELGVIQSSQKVIKVVYNVLLERYDSMELGQASWSLSDLLNNDELNARLAALLNEANEIVKQQGNELYALMMHQSDLITGGLGGHVVLKMNALDQPEEILIMDTDDVLTAINVIRMNQNGIGFSTNGYQGPYTTAWTIDGVFNADFIAAGSILANYIRGGTLTLGGIGNQYGVLSIIDGSGNTIGTWKNDGINTSQFRADFSGGYLSVGTNGFYMTSGNTNVELGSMWQGSVLTKSWALTFDDGSNYANATLAPGYLNVGYGYSGNPVDIITQISYGGWDDNAYRLRVDGGLIADKLYVSGTKTRLVETNEYGRRLLYCYETPTPMFADVGEGTVDETGVCYVFLDPVFAETITTNQYQVFLQRYGKGDCYVSERKQGYFVVTGEPGLKFGWELKAKQRDYDQLRLEKDVSYDIRKNTYGEQGSSYYIEIMEGRIAS